MVILFIVFLFQFGVSCSCLAMNRGQQVSARLNTFSDFPRTPASLFILCFVFLLFQETLLTSAWGILQNKTKIDLEDQLNCCGLINSTDTRQQFEQDLLHCTAVSLPIGSLIVSRYF